MPITWNDPFGATPLRITSNGTNTLVMMIVAAFDATDVQLKCYYKYRHTCLLWWHSYCSTQYYSYDHQPWYGNEIPGWHLRLWWSRSWLRLTFTVTCYGQMCNCDSNKMTASGLTIVTTFLIVNNHREYSCRHTTTQFAITFCSDICIFECNDLRLYLIHYNNKRR